MKYIGCISLIIFFSCFKSKTNYEIKELKARLERFFVSRISEAVFGVRIPLYKAKTFYDENLNLRYHNNTDKNVRISKQNGNFDVVINLIATRPLKYYEDEFERKKGTFHFHDRLAKIYLTVFKYSLDIENLYDKISSVTLKLHNYKSYYTKKGGWRDFLPRKVEEVKPIGKIIMKRISSHDKLPLDEMCEIEELVGEPYDVYMAKLKYVGIISHKFLESIKFEVCFGEWNEIERK